MINNNLNSKNILYILGLIILIVLFATGRGVSINVESPDGSGAPVEVAPPAQDAQENVVSDWFFGLLAAVPSVISVAALGGMTGGSINLLKMTGLFTKLDDQSGKIAVVLNLVAFGAVALGNLFGMGEKVQGLIEQFGLALPTVVTLLSMFGFSRLVHWLMKMLDPVAFSLTQQGIRMKLIGG